MRARTSSLRLVSWVEVVSSVAGQSLLSNFCCFVERGHADPELLRFAADFIERGQPVEDVKRRVLQSLGHDRPGALLKLENKVRVLGSRFLIEVFRETKEQNVAQEIEDRFFDRRVATLGRRRPRARSRRDLPRSPVASAVEVSAINRETGDGLAHGAGERIEREIAEPAILFRKPIEHVAENVDVVGQRQSA